MKSPHHLFSVLLCTIFVNFAADYFPIAVGNSWTSVSTGDIPNGTNRVAPETNNDIPSVTLAIVGKSIMGKDTIFKVTATNNETGEIETDMGYIASDGNDVIGVDSPGQEEPYYKLMEHQPIAGSEWLLAEVKRKIVYYGTITVLAGTFASCYATVDDGDTLDVYAPDVGQVATFQEGKMIIQLSSYIIVSSSKVRFNTKPEMKEQPFSFSYRNTDHVSVVNVLGRCVNNGTTTRKDNARQSTAPGIYFQRDANPIYGERRMQKRCVIGW